MFFCSTDYNIQWEKEESELIIDSFPGFCYHEVRAAEQSGKLRGGPSRKENGSGKEEAYYYDHS